MTDNDMSVNKRDLECNKLLNDSIDMTTKEDKICSIEGSRESSSSNISDNLSQSLEKCDITPENSKKSDCDLNVIGSAGHQKPSVSMDTQMNDNRDQMRYDDQTTKNIQQIQTHQNNFPKSISLQEMPSSDKTKDLMNNKLIDNVLRIDEDEKIEENLSKPANAALAFTVDFGDNKNVDNEKYKSMLERFQNRHKRGQSLSKLEDENKNNNQAGGIGVNSIRTKTPQSVKLPRKVHASPSINSESSFSSDHDDIKSNKSGNVVLRKRDKSQDPSKRHSWGPRTSALSNDFVSANQQASSIPIQTSKINQTIQSQHSTKPLQPSNVSNTTKPLQSVYTTNVIKSSQSTNVTNATKFTPRSATLTLALKSNEDTKKIELQCPIPPLENFKTIDGEDSVSEAGTYTLDGDNYTEEQKEKMNIDSMAKEERERAAKCNSKTINKIEVLEITDLDDDYEQSHCKSDVMIPNKNIIQNNLNDDSLLSPSSQEARKNILEISYYHTEPTNIKSKVSYLDKIKARVKNMSKSKTPELISPDIGSFTSITTCGVLSIKPALERNPKLTRKNSLTKSQIDSSEYVQGVSRFNVRHEDDTMISDDTSNITNDENIINYNNNKNLSVGGTTNLTTAATKIDWIQEWAKNAREYSQSPNSSLIVEPSQQNAQQRVPNSNQPSSQYPISKSMSRSYEFENQHRKYNNVDDSEDYSIMTKSSEYSNYDEEYGNNLDRNTSRKVNNVDRHRNIGNYEYYSDPNLKLVRASAQQQYQQRLPPPQNLDYARNSPSSQNNNIYNNTKNYYRDYDASSQQNYPSMEIMAARPPMSPSKIPSPIHSISRARGSSRNRSRNGSTTVSFFFKLCVY